MSDRVYESFLKRQLEEGMALAAASDLVDLLPVDGTPPRRYIAHYSCKGLVRDERGEIVPFDQMGVMIWFPPSYLRSVETPEILTYLGPHPQPWHPNIRPPFICVHLAPGTPLVSLLYTCFELWTWNLSATGDNGLNPAAAQWARNNRHRFPVDRRFLKRRRLNLECGETAKP